MLSETVGGFIPESEVAILLRDTEKAFENCQIGSYPFFREGKVGSNFVVRSTDEAALKACMAQLCDGLEAAGFAYTQGGI